MFELNNFDSVQIGVASPEKIREWSYGEVTKPETITGKLNKVNTIISKLIKTYKPTLQDILLIQTKIDKHKLTQRTI